MAPKCFICETNPAMLKRPKTGKPFCKGCFFSTFEEEIHQTIINEKLFEMGETIALGASGGKDSTVLIHVMKTLCQRYDYGTKFILISVDEGIKGYRDDSIKTVQENEKFYAFPLKIVSYKELYGWTMDEIVQKIGTKNNCTVCGVFRRQALDRAALALKATKIATGHNADDMAETILMNVLRGDYNRLIRCSSSLTYTDKSSQNDGCCNDNHDHAPTTNDSHCTTRNNSNNNNLELLPRCKPLKYCFEKEIVMYAHYKKLTYFATECTYAPNSFRGHVRAYLKSLERVRPQSILDIIASGDEISRHSNVATTVNNNNNTKTSSNTSGTKGQNAIKPSIQTLKTCNRCGYISSQPLCKACILLEGFNSNVPALGIGKTGKIRRQLAAIELGKSSNDT